MADADIDPFGEHKTDLHPDDTGENIPLLLVSLYKESSKHYSQTSDATYYDNFRRKGKWPYFKGKDEPLTNEDGKLRTFGRLKSILGKPRLCDLGFDVPRGPTPRQVVALNEAEEVMPSTYDVAKVDAIELQEITENVMRSTENLIV